MDIEIVILHHAINTIRTVTILYTCINGYAFIDRFVAACTLQKNLCNLLVTKGICYSVPIFKFVILR